MDVNLIGRYLGLRRLLRATQEEIDRLRPVIFREVTAAGGCVDHEGLRIVAQVLRTWSFSEQVHLLATILKEKRREEISSGTATLKTETQFVTVRPVPKQEGPRLTSGVSAARQVWPKADDLTRIRVAHPRAYEGWTQEEDMALTRQHQQGRAIPELAAIFQRQIGGIRSRLRKLGLIQ